MLTTHTVRRQTAHLGEIPTKNQTSTTGCLSTSNSAKRRAIPLQQLSFFVTDDSFTNSSCHSSECWWSVTALIIHVIDLSPSATSASRLRKSPSLTLSVSWSIGLRSVDFRLLVWETRRPIRKLNIYFIFTITTVTARRMLKAGGKSRSQFNLSHETIADNTFEGVGNMCRPIVMYLSRGGQMHSLPRGNNKTAKRPLAKSLCTLVLGENVCWQSECRTASQVR